MDSELGFSHQRLDVYETAQRLVIGVVRATEAMPRGTLGLRDQARRSALSTVRHITEGANRLTPSDRKSRFVIARGEVAECDSVLDTLTRLALVSESHVRDLRNLCARVSAMLSGLINRESRLLGD